MNIYKEYQPTGGQGSYVKFEDNKPVRLRIVSEPAIFDNIYEGRVTGTKYAWIVYNVEEGEVQILQLPKTGYRAVAAIAADEDYGDPAENNYDLKITRTGQRQQTKYNIVPVSGKYELTKEDQEAIADIDLIDRLSKSPSADRVAWLREEVQGKRPAASTKDTVADVDTDEPINLDDVPL